MNAMPYAFLGLQAMSGMYSAYSSMRSGHMAEMMAGKAAKAKEQDAYNASVTLGLRRNEAEREHKNFKGSMISSFAGAGVNINSATSADLSRESDLNQRRRLIMMGYGTSMQVAQFHRQAESLREKGRAARITAKMQGRTTLFDTATQMTQSSLYFWGDQGITPTPYNPYGITSSGE